MNILKNTIGDPVQRMTPTFSGIDTLADIGCFGLTELGYGNNAVEMETTAIFDQETGTTGYHSNNILVTMVTTGYHSNTS